MVSKDSSKCHVLYLACVVRMISLFLSPPVYDKQGFLLQLDAKL